MDTSQKMKRKIILYLESRASYSYALPLINLLKKNKKNVVFKTIVTGMHLEKEFGSTIREIQKDKVKTDYKLKFLKKKNWSYSIGQQVIKCTEIINKFNPDIVVLFGDRVELVPISISCAYNGTIIAHVQAGDKSGHIDDMTRMMLAKISHIHLPSNEKSKKRLIKLGEQNFRIFKVGAPQLDDINYSELIKVKHTFINNKKFELKKEKFIVLIQHPVFVDRKNYKEIFLKTLKACLYFDYKIIIIYPNYDPGYKSIVQAINNVNKKEKKVILLKNLERSKFLKLLINAKCLVGNSSCGVLEAPTLKVGVVNIGDRQDGREKNLNIVDCNHSEREIKQKINFIISNSKFKKKLKYIKNFYGDGNSSPKILKILLSIKINKKLVNKKTTY